MVLTPGDPRLLVGGHVLFLSRPELTLLTILAEQDGRAVSTASLAKSMGRGGNPLSRNGVAVRVHRLRMRLEPERLYIRTVRGFGYLLSASD